MLIKGHLGRLETALDAQRRLLEIFRCCGDEMHTIGARSVFLTFFNPVAHLLQPVRGVLHEGKGMPTTVFRRAPLPASRNRPRVTEWVRFSFLASHRVAAPLSTNEDLRANPGKTAWYPRLASMVQLPRVQCVESSTRFANRYTGSHAPPVRV